MSAAQELAELYRRDLTRLIQELQAFPQDETLWKRLPGVTNPAGVIALHLEGNLRDYIGRLVGHIPYERQREAEFTVQDVSAAELIQRFEQVREMVYSVISGLSPVQLESIYPLEMWGAPIPTQQVLMAMLGHLNYHMGQIDYLRRILTEGQPIQFAKLQAGG